MTEVSEEEDQSLTLNLFKEAATSIGLAAIFGACLRDPVTQKPRNTFCLARPDSEALIIYSKIHPFSFAGEDKVLEAGNRLGTARVGELNFGATICYDLRFPELYSAMASQCNAIITIANWPERRVNHWRSLLVARAIENQCFMFGVNRIGIDGNGLGYQKSSIAVTPDGELIEPVIPGHELDIYEIEPADAATYRASFPTLRDKRYELYSELLRKY
jgi:predicted amidohydrolase